MKSTGRASGWTANSLAAISLTFRGTKSSTKHLYFSVKRWTTRIICCFRKKKSNNWKGGPYLLLQRVFKEQYKIGEETQEVLLRPKEEIVSSSVQSPHDPDSAYRQKTDQKVKGFSVNVTETISDGRLNLITNVIVEKANVPDTVFVEPAISATRAITGDKVENVYADGAYQSPANDVFCKDIDMVFTGIQGAASRYGLEMSPEGLQVADTKAGEHLLAGLAKKLKKQH